MKKLLTLALITACLTASAGTPTIRISVAPWKSVLCLTCEAPAGSTWRLQKSTNLTTWSDLELITADASGRAITYDLNLGTTAFYRLAQ